MGCRTEDTPCKELTARTMVGIYTNILETLEMVRIRTEIIQTQRNRVGVLLTRAPRTTNANILSEYKEGRQVTRDQYITKNSGIYKERRICSHRNSMQYSSPTACCKEKLDGYNKRASTFPVDMPVDVTTSTSI